MTKVELIQKLEKQLAILRADGEAGYPVQEFKVLLVEDDLAAAAARVEKRTWSMGWCTSETCNHFSHKQYSKGDTVFLACRPVGRDEEGRKLFLLPNQRLVRYMYAHEMYARLEFV